MVGTEIFEVRANEVVWKVRANEVVWKVSAGMRQ
jgi:hypothetical protein